MRAADLEQLMKNVAVGSAATCFAAGVVLVILYVYAHAKGRA